MSNHATRFLSGDARGRAPMPGLGNALLRCNSIDELRTLAPLPKDAQELIDRAVVRVGLDRLIIVQDLMAEGLTYSLPDPLSVMELYWERADEIGDARRVMLPHARGEDQLAEFDGQRIPIYATIDDFTLNIRTLRASERAGAPLDTFQVEQATRRVNESIEDAAINGAGLAVGGNSAPGLLDAPNKGTSIYTGGEAWDASGHTGEEILGDVLAMVDVAQAAKKYGPYNLYIPTEYGNKLNADFKANSALTIRQRLEELEVGGRNLRIRVADLLPDDRTALVQMTSDVIDVIVGQEPTVISWESGDGFVRYFIVMAFVVPRVRDDYDGNSGIVIGYIS